jgi:hypothetical protein
MSVYPNRDKVYTRDTQQANYQCSILHRAPVGFDLEWKPSFHRGRYENPVALVQLANKDSILLLQVSAMSGELFWYIHISH